MATPRIPAAIDWLLATFTAAPTLAGVEIYDGPSPRRGDENVDGIARTLWVGVDDPDLDMPEAATGDQNWAGLGAGRRDELFSINCVAAAWSGGDDMATVRTAAFGVAGAAADIVRANASLGDVILIVLPGVTGQRLRQSFGPQGMTAMVQFHIDCKARI